MFSFNVIIVMNNSQISPKVVSDSYYYEVLTTSSCWYATYTLTASVYALATTNYYKTRKL